MIFSEYMPKKIIFVKTLSKERFYDLKELYEKAGCV